ncbi:MAG TPA: VOC family protein [Thermoanaerobaculia bacterium]|jgi:catechol 2,3-dioxygenase|nr:VOC family protein [Thermoanaerobaculia bacterium]
MSTPAPLPYGKPPRGYRLPDATRLGRVVLQVADLTRSIAYYEQVIGLRLLDRSGGTAALGAPGQAGDAPALVELRERPGARSMPPLGRLGLYHFAILLPERAALGRFIAHLGRLGAHAGMSDHLVSESVYLHDPDGLGIEVYADRPRSTWQHRGRELVMATEPLDVEAVVAAGGGVPWTGAPAGTVLGHVHLHVGSLEEAAAFYHEGIGFDERVWSYPGALFLAAGGYHHHLGVNTWARGAVPAGPEDARLLEWEIVVPSLEDAQVPAGGVTRDPWGVGIRWVGRT